MTKSTRTAVSVGCLILTTLLLIPPSVFIQRLAGAENPARDAVVAAIWVPELLQVKHLLMFVLSTGVGQLGAYAVMGICLLNQGMVASVLCAFCLFLAMAFWMVLMNSRIGVELNIAISSVLAAASLATIALAYRRWQCMAG